LWEKIDIQSTINTALRAFQQSTMLIVDCWQSRKAWRVDCCFKELFPQRKS